MTSTMTDPPTTEPETAPQPEIDPKVINELGRGLIAVLHEMRREYLEAERKSAAS